MKFATAVVLVVALACAAKAADAGASDPARSVAFGAAAQLESRYVYPSRAAEAAKQLRRNADAGAYDGLRADALADKLTADIAPVLHDKHVHVRYSADVVLPPPDAEGTPTPQRRAAFTAMMREGGFGLGRVEHLPGNVGYLDVRFFPQSNPDSDVVFDAMVNAVAYSEAIVLDLRRNHGGSPDTVARLLSHFVPPKTHVNDFVARGDGDPAVVESTYTADVPGPRITVPLYVLISRETFSGGEECAYDVQALRRGTLVGEVTGGGANPGGDRRIDDHFEIFVPDERARNPVTMTNWEGTGVKPDVAVARDHALGTAYDLILDAKLRDANLRPAQHAALADLRAKLGAMSDAQILAL